MQRQGAFGSIFFKTKLGVTAANDAELTNMDNNISEIVSASLDVSKNSVMFEFKTPLSAGIRYELRINVFIELIIQIMVVIKISMMVITVVLIML